MDKKNFIRLFISICFIAFLFGCVTTKPVKPNNPYQGPYPVKFNKISDRNPLLAEEIGKLPELQDGISEKENIALLQLVKLYEMHPLKFDDAFDEMYTIGLPGIRKYCTPLQALFWLVEIESFYEVASQIKDYKLRNLLSVAWKFQKKTFEIDELDISEEQASHIISSIDKDIIWYAKHQKSPIHTLLYCYNRTPNAIPIKFRKEIENMPKIKLALDQFKKHRKRWEETNLVIERLNAPALFDYYVNKNIIYKHIFPAYHRPPTYVIKEKFGDCDDLAYFGKIVLSKAGYDLIGRFYNKEATINHIILGIKLEDGSYFKAVDFGRRGNIMGGPYKTVLEMDQAAGYGRWYQTREAFSFHW